jgi:hypothetical protein
MKWTVLIGLGLLAFGSLPAISQTPQQAVLEGIKTIYVVSLPANADAVADGLDMAHALTEVELKLRENGIKVVESDPTRMYRRLSIQIGTLKHPATQTYAVVVKFH